MCLRYLLKGKGRWSKVARTTNRYLVQKEPDVIKKRNVKWKTGNYIRLSVESNISDSNSIENQMALGKEYEKNHDDIEIVATYIDDGMTGTNFSRDGFQKMMEDIRNEVINCVLVKDLSRFGRDYLEAGNYIDKVFPFLGVRFISMNDQYDSIDLYCDRQAFANTLKNLMHETYARDVSRKVSASIEMKQKTNIFYRTSTIPYGYKMDENNRRYDVDEPAATVVRQMFRWCAEGKTCYMIKQMLTEKGVNTPSQYKKKKKIYRDEQDQIVPWSQAVVSKILRNPIYTGVALRHKTEKRYCYDIPLHPIEKEQQILMKEAAEPIIGTELFETVQGFLKERSEKTASQKRKEPIESILYAEEVLFGGILFCGDCGAPMGVQYLKKSCQGKTYMMRGYVCGNHRKYKYLCDTKCIEEMELCSIVKEAIKKQVQLLKGVRKKADQTVESVFERQKRKLDQAWKKLNNDQMQMKHQYMERHEKYSLGSMKEEDFQKFREHYINEMDYIQCAFSQIEEKRKENHRQELSLKKLIKEWLQFNRITRLDSRMIQIFIKRIDIYSEKRIEITFCYADEFASLQEYVKAVVQ